MYENYKRIRDLKGFKDSDVSKATGIAKSTFSDWKSGRSTPKHDKIVKISEFLEVDVKEIEEANFNYDFKTQEIKRKPGMYVNYKCGGEQPIDMQKISKEVSELSYYVNDEAREYAEFLHKNPQYQVLFDASKKVKVDDIQKALKLLGVLTDGDEE